MRRRGIGGAVAAVAVAALLATAPAAGQARECGTALGPETAAALLAQQRAGAYERPSRGKDQPEIQHVLRIPLAIHVVRRWNASEGLSSTDVDQTIADANAHYAPAGMEFFQSGLIRYIDNEAFYYNIDTQAEIDALRQTDVVANAVNVYFTANLEYEGGVLCGQASFTTDAVQGVVLANGCTAAGGNQSTFAHELGHYFDLFHTHETAMGVECPNYSNCSTAGDLLCDTPADPTLDSGNMNSSCAYTGTAQACGSAYAPDTHNLMSYADPKSCRDHFSQGQIDRMLGTIGNLRPGIVAGGVNKVVWVDLQLGSPTGNGTFASPYLTFAAAVAAAPPGATLVIKSSSRNETVTVSKPLSIDTFRGPAYIGN